MSARNCSTELRSFAGPAADELAILCRPEHGATDAGGQAAAAYRALAERLAGEGASFRDVARETIFLRDIRRDLPLVRQARARVLAELGDAGGAPRPVCIEQAPAAADAAFELLASAVVPHDRRAWEVRDLPHEGSCACEGCRGSGARLIRLGEQVSLHAANLYGVGDDAYAQAWDAFRAAERLLERSGMGFGDVVRTWIHLRDIDRDYDALNAARREFFAHCGIERRPASTGVEGGPFPDLHCCSLSFHAVKSPRLLDVRSMSSPLLNEAWSYGADFSRGLRVAEANTITLYVSGTASIDEAGRTAHPRDFEGQAERMLDNIASLLEGQGGSFASVLFVVTDLRRESDAPALRAAYRRRGFAGFPCALVTAALCRPELLCEAEAVAVLPQAVQGA